MDQSITCTACGKPIPLTRALRAEIERSVRLEFEAALVAREGELREDFRADIERIRVEAAASVESELSRKINALEPVVDEQAQTLVGLRQAELVVQERGRELDRRQRELELELSRTLEKERLALIDEARARVTDSAG